jgi:hypothetical protein
VGQTEKAISLNSLFYILNNQCMDIKKVEGLWTHLHGLTILTEQGALVQAGGGESVKVSG